MSDLISRADAINKIQNEYRKWGEEYGISDVLCDLDDMPSAQPTYTDDEIQKMQDLEQAQIEKAFQLGREDAIPIEWIEEWCISQDLTYIKIAVEKLLDDWRKEHDKTD